MEDKSLFEKLDADIDTRILPKTNYIYIPAKAIRNRLNEVFDCDWGTEIMESNIIDNDTVVLRLRLSFPVKDYYTYKEGFGSAPIQRFSSGPNKGNPVNLGDAYNNAVTDAIKTCAKQLGIGNRQLDVTKDPQTGEYIEVDDMSYNTGTEEQDTNSDKPSNKKPVLKSEGKGEVNSKSKIIELKERLAMSKTNRANKKENTSTPDTNIDNRNNKTDDNKPTNDSVTDLGFDYGELSGETTRKNMQKLVILNLAKMQKMSIEDYIEKGIGKQKSIDDLTSEEAGALVRSGLTNTNLK